MEYKNNIESLNNLRPPYKKNFDIFFSFINSEKMVVIRMSVCEMVSIFD